jgi:hypothetical protein
MSYMGQMLLTRLERLITFVRFVWAFHSVDMIFVFSYVSLLVWETECRFTHQNWMHCSSVTHLKPVTGFQRILQELFSNQCQCLPTYFMFLVPCQTLYFDVVVMYFVAMCTCMFINT